MGLKNRPNFRIIENNNEVDYEEFKKDYSNSSLLKEEIRKKYDLRPSDFKDLVKKCEDEGVIRERPRKKHIFKNFSKYYYKTKKGYVVTKYVGNKSVYYGQYKYEEDAKKIVEWLKEHNWDKELFKQNKTKIIGEYCKNYYFNKPSQKYVVYKENTYYGYYKSEEDAKRIVKALREEKWDKDKIKEIEAKIL